MSSPSPQEKPEQLWAEVLNALKLKTTRATYNSTFLSSRLVIQNGDWVVELKDNNAADWAEHRLRRLVEHTLATYAPGDELPAIRFGVKSQPQAEPMSGLSPANVGTEVKKAASAPALAGLDYRKLWFGDGTSGFSMRAHYIEKFWQAYLGRAYSLWSLIQADNRQNKNYWTPAKKYRYRYLARSLGCGFSTIRGGLRPCNCYEKSKDRGELLTECCGRYHPVKWGHITADGNHQCMHWNPGLMEKLYNEGLLAIEEKGDSGKPQSHILRLQVWTLLPLLTPKQVETLSDPHQLEHERWLERIAQQADFEIETWEALAEETLVSQMADYNRGRTLFDIYQPNPLLENDVSGDKNGELQCANPL